MTDRAALYDTLEAFVQRLLSCVHGGSLDQLVELDLTMSQARTLFTVAQADRPIPISQIATQVDLSLAATGRTVDSLVRLGVLDRREDPDDRRVKLIALTDAGFAAADQQLAHKQAMLRTVADRLDPAHAEELNRVLGKILASDALRLEEERDAHG